MQDVVFDSLELFQCRQCGEPIKADSLEPFSSTSCPLCQSHNRVPAKFGPFLLLERLGDGIMSVVFDALDPKLDRKISIKILNYVLSKNHDLVEAFKREALAAAALNANNVLKVYEFGLHNGQPFMVMEQIEGTYLNELLRRETLDGGEILSLMEGIARGLSETHEAGIVHGEVMPRNILVDPNRTPKLCEFGLARFTHDGDTSQPSWSSPYYMPPERILGEVEDHRGDIYSLGTTLFYMLTGHLPFFDMDDDVVRQRKIDEEAPHPRELKETADPSLSDLAKQMLERNPEDRVGSWDELLDRLADMSSAVNQRTLPVPPKADLRPNPNAKKSTSQSQGGIKKPFPWPMALILLAGAIAAYVIFALDQKRTVEQEAYPTPIAFPTARPTEVLLNLDKGASDSIDFGQESEPVDFSPTNLGEPTPTPAPTATPTPTAVPPTPTPVPVPTATPAPISAADLPNRALHLNAGHLDKKPFDRIRIWEDQSGGNAHFRQSAQLYQPEWVPEAIDHQPALLFDNKLMISALQPFLHKQFTIMITAQDAGSTDNLESTEYMLLAVDPAADGLPRMLIYLDKKHPRHLCFETKDGVARIAFAADSMREPFTAGISRNAKGQDVAVLNGITQVISGDAPDRGPETKTSLPFLQLGGISGEQKYFAGFVGEVLFLTEALSERDLVRITDRMRRSYIQE